MGVALHLEGTVGRQQALNVLTRAFEHDPVERWLFPEENDYQSFFPQFLMAFGGRAFEAHTVWALGDLSAVAMWLPPGVEADAEAIISLLAGFVAADKLEDTFAVLDQMDSAHPSYDHWYLPWLGVDPDHQGGGLGNQLISSCLATVDSSHLPAYLETPNPRNISLYARHGFEVRGEARSGTCPPITFMERPAV